MANPQRGLDKWQRNTAAAGQSMKDGIDDVAESPGAAANRNKDKYIRNVTDAYNNGAYEAGNNSYTLQDWKTAAKEKGVNNAVAGVNKISARSKANIVAALNQANAIKAETANMPNNSEQDGLEKVRKSMQMWKAFKASRTR